ncbi:hypothetical protein [Enterobacter sp. WCHEn090032]|nr:hypothetical protein [Enterobacter sp. WCHEn090032]
MIPKKRLAKREENETNGGKKNTKEKVVFNEEYSSSLHIKGRLTHTK